MLSMAGGERQNWNEPYCDIAGSSPSPGGDCAPPAARGISIGGEWLRASPGPAAADGCICFAAASEPACWDGGASAALAPEKVDCSSKAAHPESASSHVEHVKHVHSHFYGAKLAQNMPVIDLSTNAQRRGRLVLDGHSPGAGAEAEAAPWSSNAAHSATCTQVLSYPTRTQAKHVSSWVSPRRFTLIQTTGMRGGRQSEAPDPPEALAKAEGSGKACHGACFLPCVNGSKRSPDGSLSAVRINASNSYSCTARYNCWAPSCLPKEMHDVEDCVDPIQAHACCEGLLRCLMRIPWLPSCLKVLRVKHFKDLCSKWQGRAKNGILTPGSLTAHHLCRGVLNHNRIIVHVHHHDIVIMSLSISLSREASQSPHIELHLS